MANMGEDGVVFFFLGSASSPTPPPTAPRCGVVGFTRALASGLEAGSRRVTLVLQSRDGHVVLRRPEHA